MKQPLKSILFLILCITILQAKQPLKKSTVYLNWKHQFEYAGYYIAKEKGFYEEYGLDVNIKEVTFRSKPIIDFIEKDLYTFGTSFSTLVVDKVNGKKVTALGAIYQSSPHVLLSLKSSNIKSIKDFKNKTIMMNNKLTQTASFISMINSEGLSLMDMKRIDYSYRIDELINKKADIAPFYASNQTFILEKKGIEYDTWDPQDYGFDFYDGIIYTGQNTLEHDPIAVENFKQATIRGFEYAFNNIEQTVKLILAKYNSQNKTKEHLLYEAKILKKYAFKNNTPLGDINKNKIQRIYDIYNILGFMENKLDIDQFVYKKNKSFTLSTKEKKYLKTKNSLNLCIDSNSLPFEKIDKNGNYTGITADYFKLFQEQYNLPIKLITTNLWDERLEAIKENRCDILSAVVFSKQRQKYLSFTKPYLKSELVVATKEDVPFITNFKSLTKKHKLGILKSHGNIEELKTKYPNLHIIEIQNNEDGLNRVIKGELFGYIDTLASIGYMFQTKFTGELKVAGKLDESLKLRIGINKNEQPLVDIFNNLINSIPHETNQQIFNKWIAINYSENKIDYELLFQITFVVFILILFLLYRQYLLKTTNINLQQVVDKKTKELKELNKNLENKIKDATAENRKKDHLLMQKNKLADMGDMIKNIAHQWRQPLATSNMAISLLRTKNKQNQLTQKELEKKLNNIESLNLHMSQTIEDFLSFFNPKKKHEKFYIKLSVEKTLELLQPQIKRLDIEVIQKIEETLTMESFLDDYVQVLISIITNSFHAYQPKQNKKLFITAKEKGEFIHLEISDNAGGIPKDIIDKIFDPYFTTKHQSNGTGLGLYISKIIIENKMGGTLSVDNTKDGVRFTIVTKKESNLSKDTPAKNFSQRNLK